MACCKHLSVSHAFILAHGRLRMIFIRNERRERCSWCSKCLRWDEIGLCCYCLDPRRLSSWYVQSTPGSLMADTENSWMYITPSILVMHRWRKTNLNIFISKEPKWSRNLLAFFCSCFSAILPFPFPLLFFPAPREIWFTSRLFPSSTFSFPLKVNPNVWQHHELEGRLPVRPLVSFTPEHQQESHKFTAAVAAALGAPRGWEGRGGRSAHWNHTHAYMHSYIRKYISVNVHI